MRVREGRRGLLRRRASTVQYDPEEQGVGALGGPGSAGDAQAAPSWEAPGPEGASRERGFRDLSIIWPMIEGEEGEEGVRVSSSVGSLGEPTVEDTLEASGIAEAAARELAELARVEDGPELEGEGDLAPPEARPGEEAGEGTDGEMSQGSALEVEPEPEPEPVLAPKPKPKPKVKSTSRKVKHPAGALRSRGSKVSQDEDASYADELAMTGVAEWDASKDGDEGEEDLFNPRRVEDEALPEDDDHAAWEEERIAAIVREREDWDSL
jgi:ribonuclease E